MTEKEEKLYQDRLKKLEKIRKAGIDPYPAKGERTHTVAEALKLFERTPPTPSLSKRGQRGSSVILGGRIKALRAHGGLVFGNIEDESGAMQFMLREEDLGRKKFGLFANFDIGDIFQATGTLTETKRGEKTLVLSDFKILTKSLRALPDQYHKLKDETRLRKRYLDLLADRELREMFRKKAIFWQSMRDFLKKNDFLEVETPVFEDVPGGAEAEPFITHYNALDKDFYLRISLELPLKRLLVGGYEKVFEIGRIFRNEGISSTHMQDYTQMEFYWAYADFEQLMEFVQEMYRYVLQKTFGTLKIIYRDVECDWGGTWKKKNYIDVFKDWTGINLETALDDDLKKYADSKHIKYESFAQRGRLIDLIFKRERAERSEKDRGTKQTPFFLINQPVELEPLAKRVPGNPKLVQRMQVIAYDIEFGKGFGELNDPIDQRARFQEQMKLREAGDKEAQQLDADFVEALEYGMPPAVGFGVSERLFTLLVPPGDKSVREGVLFPPMKQEGEQEGKSKITKMAVAVVNKGAKLEPWQELNTIAHLNAAFAAREGRQLLYQDEITTSDNEAIKLNIQHAIMIKTAKSNNELQRLADEAKSCDLHVAEFTREMIETTDDKKVIEWTKKKKRKDVEHLGVLIFGKKSDVEALTKELPLYE